ncbi:TetR/AcrR family transcriptional regulator [Thermomonas sp.]|uniref:TetR/AcrR family transcriptional regulator n=1 Tax=Thermomonas sp. TaxID=1971895 RepID=UPI001AC44DA0|nr:TetR/AcrR family transcriptional regulator [Xanthomonadales bacterium]MBN8768589.1 TetR/AcrR family transcriptional regulator [Stenotrophomonas sp.]
MTPAKPARAPAQPPKAASPGRPKDLAKRAAILEAAKRMFVQHGFDRVSMDQVAAEAGVSKLTVYSHFGDKDSLFAEAVRAHCEQNLPQRLFEAAPDAPLRERLLAIGQAFFAMIMAPEAVAGHRILCSPQVAARGMAGMFWEAGPERVKAAFRNLLEDRIARGELEIDDPARAAGHFFALLKGDPHAQAVLGCQSDDCLQAAQAHVASVVDLFLRAYAVRSHDKRR